MIMKITTGLILELIADDRFTFEVEHERDRNAQPLRTMYYVGRPKKKSGVSFNIQWKPKEQKLTAWEVKGSKPVDITNDCAGMPNFSTLMTRRIKASIRRSA